MKRCRQDLIPERDRVGQKALVKCLWQNKRHQVLVPRRRMEASPPERFRSPGQEAPDPQRLRFVSIATKLAVCNPLVVKQGRGSGWSTGPQNAELPCESIAWWSFLQANLPQTAAVDTEYAAPLHRASGWQCDCSSHSVGVGTGDSHGIRNSSKNF